MLQPLVSNFGSFFCQIGSMGTLLLMVQKSAKLTSWYGKYLPLFLGFNTSKRWLAGLLNHQRYILSNFRLPNLETHGIHVSSRWISCPPTPPRPPTLPSVWHKHTETTSQSTKNLGIYVQTSDAPYWAPLFFALKSSKTLRKKPRKKVPAV